MIAHFTIGDKMIDNINTQLSTDVSNSLDDIELANDTTADATQAAAGTSFNNLLQIFNAITTDVLAAISINNANTSDVTSVAPSITTNTTSFTPSVSTDGEQSSPALKPAPSLETVADSIVDKIEDNGNTIKLGNISYKDRP